MTFILPLGKYEYFLFIQHCFHGYIEDFTMQYVISLVSKYDITVLTFSPFCEMKYAGSRNWIMCLLL